MNTEYNSISLDNSSFIGMLQLRVPAGTGQGGAGSSSDASAASAQPYDLCSAQLAAQTAG